VCALLSKVGKDADIGAQITVPRVRGDKVLWVDSSSISASQMSGTQSMLEALDRLVLSEMSPQCARLERLKDRTDPMLAIYPGTGSRFQKHVDNTVRDGRRLTVLCYLNPEWREEDGGKLRVHSPLPTDKAEVSVNKAWDVSPDAGRVALFFSDAVPHEVLPSHSERHAVTVWYYDATERKEALAKTPSMRGCEDDADSRRQQQQRAAPSEAEAEKEKAHLRSRHEARAFLLWILGSDKVATQDQVEAITQRAMKLTPMAVRIVAGVVGAPSPEDAMEALGRLTPSTLQKLRADLNEMGIGGGGD